MKCEAFRASILHFLDDPAKSASAYQYFDDGLLIVSDGKVECVGAAASLLPSLAADIKVTVYDNALIFPGFIDSHVHYPQIDIIASYGEQLLSWLEKYTFPSEARFKDEIYAKKVAEFFIQELLRNGTTTAAVFPTVHKESVEAILSSAQHYNIRMICGKVMMDRNAPDALLDTPASSYQESVALIEKWHGKSRLQYAVTPRFAITSTEQQLTMAMRLLQEYPGVYLQSHLAENVAEVKLVGQLFPWAKDYLAVYEHFNLVTEKSLFAHAVHLQREHFNRLTDNGAIACFCPSSNLFIGSGLFNLKVAEECNTAVALASDIGAGTSLSMLQTLNNAYKVLQLQGYSLSPLRSFYHITLGAAKALSLDTYVGNFAPGKEADFVVLDKAATPLLSHRMGLVQTIEEVLFLFMMLGDDRAIKASYVMGRQHQVSNLGQI